MKIIKYLLYLIGGLLVIFFAFGLLNPSVNYGHEIQVNKSAKEAWAVSKDESKYAQWLEGFKSIELLSGEQDAIGSKYKVVVQPAPDQPEFEMTQTIADFKEFEYATLHFDSDMMDFEQTISFNEADGKTTIKSDSNVKGKGIMMRSMFAMMETLGGTFTAQEAKNFENLKKLVDENTTDYFPAPVMVEEAVDSTEVVGE